MSASQDSSTDQLQLGFTTTESRSDAEALARAGVESGLVACVQVDGPITSFFSWRGKQEEATEYRLLFKFPSSRGGEVAAWIQSHHPYDTPEWVVVAARHTAEKYLQWARETTS